MNTSWTAFENSKDIITYPYFKWGKSRHSAPDSKESTHRSHPESAHVDFSIFTPGMPRFKQGGKGGGDLAPPDSHGGGLGGRTIHAAVW